MLQNLKQNPSGRPPSKRPLPQVSTAASAAVSYGATPRFASASVHSMPSSPKRQKVGKASMSASGAPASGTHIRLKEDLPLSMGISVIEYAKAKKPSPCMRCRSAIVNGEPRIGNRSASPFFEVSDVTTAKRNVTRHVSCLVLMSFALCIVLFKAMAFTRARSCLQLAD